MSYFPPHFNANWANGPGRGKKKQQPVSNGTGYSGDATGDKKKLLEGRKRAAAEELKRDSESIKYFELTTGILQRKGLVDSSKLVASLKDTFRNQVPTDWDPRKKLFMASLACFRLVIQNYSNLLGDKDDDESLHAAFCQFAEHAHCLDKHGGASGNVTLVREVLAVQSLAEQQHTQADLLMMDPHEYYRKALGPLRFEFVDQLKHHKFASGNKAARLNTRKMFQELSGYKTSLPVEYGSSIFIRAVEDRLDLLRALITGPEDSPYENGCFLFDIHLSDYPAKAPTVHFLTTGGGTVRFNPNLYNCGKVCLSLLGTWSGPGWISGESTLLQVLVSIQSLILIPDPYFNEPGYQSFQGTPSGTKRSNDYNASIRKQTLIHAIKPFLSGNHSYPEFSDVIDAHFRNKKMRLETQMYNWMSDDSSLTSVVEEILPQFARFHTKSHKAPRVTKVPRQAVANAAAAAPPVKEVNGVIELLDEDDPVVARPLKKHNPNEVVDLLDDGDLKRAAVVREPVVLDLT